MKPAQPTAPAKSSATWVEPGEEEAGLGLQILERGEDWRQ